MSSNNNQNPTVTFRWHQATEMDDFAHCPDIGAKDAYYARTHTSGGGFSASLTNQLITNLQWKPSSSAAQLDYKRAAIKTFCDEVCQFVASNHFAIGANLLIPMPPSKTKTHPDYDNRLELVVDCIVKNTKNCTAFPVLIGTKDVQSSKSSSANRSVAKSYSEMDVDPDIAKKYVAGNRLIILDDVTTSGAHFEAARLHLLRNWPDAKISGIFWAKSKTQSPQNVFTPIP